MNYVLRDSLHHHGPAGLGFGKGLKNFVRSISDGIGIQKMEPGL